MAGTLKKSETSYPELYRQHQATAKELDRKMKALRREAKKKMREDYFRDMPNEEINKQINKLLLHSAEGNVGKEESEELSEEDIDWELPALDNDGDEPGDEPGEETKSSRDTSISALDERNISTKIFIVCPDHHAYARSDYLRRHIMTQHLSRIARDGLHCNKEICKNGGIFSTASDFLNHAAKVHNYDLNFKKR
ncbi:hypothetical protein H2199_002074 [Coniosporium tulheliwenetii]|uniref:Uncharacterized protein n=1 Tax=Coniosporium tulheliwenetii TaxID=3383036 RepID=A0ACC2ZHS3_9PEZI|nr:hypothetical protein H2199_002074 [Cladosporium sp. JES 115]